MGAFSSLGETNNLFRVLILLAIVFRLLVQKDKSSSFIEVLLTVAMGHICNKFYIIAVGMITFTAVVSSQTSCCPPVVNKVCKYKQ